MSGGVTKKQAEKLLTSEGFGLTDAMVKEVHNVMNSKPFINNQELYDIASRHTRKGIIGNHGAKQTTGPTDSLNSAPENKMPLNKDRMKNLKKEHDVIIDNAVKARKQGNLAGALRLLEQVPDDSEVAKRRNNDIKITEKMIDNAIEKGQFDKLPPERVALARDHQTIIEQAKEIVKAGDHNQAINFLQTIPDDSYMKKQRDELIDEYREAMEANQEVQKDEIDPEDINV